MKKYTIIIIFMIYLFICIDPVYSGEWLSDVGDPDVVNNAASSPSQINTPAPPQSNSDLEHVTFIEAISQSENQIRIQWEQVPGDAVDYHIFRSTTIIDTPEKLSAANLVGSVHNTDNYTDTINKTGNYYYAVTTEKTGTGVKNNTLVIENSYTTQPIAAGSKLPGMVSDLTAQVSAETVVLTWKNPSKNRSVEYNIYRAATQIFDAQALNNAEAIATVDNTTKTYTDSSPNPGNNYYAITAKKGLNENRNIIIKQSSTELPAFIKSPFSPIITVHNPTTAIATNTYTITGTITDADGLVQMQITPGNIPITVDTANGTFSAPLTLQQGNNDFLITAIGPQNVSITKQFSITYQPKSKPITTDETAPVISINTIPATTEHSNIVLSGTATDTHLKSITILPHHINADFSAAGAFSATIPLDEGENALIIIAEDSYNNSAQKKLHITYTKKVSEENSISHNNTATPILPSSADTLPTATDSQEYYAQLVETINDTIYSENYETALQQINAILTADNIAEPVVNEAKLYRAITYYKMGNYAVAVKLFFNVKEQYPEIADFYISACIERL